MRVVSLVNQTLSVQEVKEPVPKTGEVLVDVLRAGICGSDKSRVYRVEESNQLGEKLTGSKLYDTDSPCVLGHEYLCRVVSYGPNSEQRIPVGTRVVAVPWIFRDGERIELGFSGPATPGGYSERMLVSEHQLLTVPDSIPDDVAAMTEVVAVALHAVELAQLTGKEAVLITGCGPVGLTILAVLKSRGIPVILASECSDERRGIASSLGANVVLDPKNDNVFEALQTAAATDDKSLMAKPTHAFGQVNVRRVVAFECSGWPGTLASLVEGIPPSATIVGVGINEKGDQVEMSLANLKCLSFHYYAYYTEEHYAQALKMITDGTVDVAPIVTKVIGLNDVPKTFEELENNPVEGKVLIDPSR